MSSGYIQALMYITCWWMFLLTCSTARLTDAVQPWPLWTFWKSRCRIGERAGRRTALHKMDRDFIIYCKDKLHTPSCPLSHFRPRCQRPLLRHGRGGKKLPFTKYYIPPPSTPAVTALVT